MKVPTAKTEGFLGWKLKAFTQFCIKKEVQVWV